MVDFSILKKTSAFEQLQKKMEKTSSGYKKDERIWKLSPDSDHKASAVIRFLPTPYVDYQKVEDGLISASDLTPIAKIIEHNFKGANGYFHELSLQTFGENCPVREFDQPLWVQAKEENDEVAKDILKTRLPREHNYCNILVLKDPANPENEGKVFLYEIPKTIDKMITTANKPEFEDQESVDAFDPINGANFKLRLTYTKKTFGGKENWSPDFKNCDFDKPSPLFDGDEDKITEVWKKEYSLVEFYDRSKFKTYDELRAKYIKVMGLNPETAKPVSPGSTISKESVEFLKAATPSAPEPSIPSDSHQPELPEDTQPDDDADTSLADFERMLNQ